jgi:hypothetical protein
MSTEALPDSGLLRDIRTKVKQALTRSAAFNAMTPDQRSEVAHNTVRAFHYILGGVDGQSRPEAVTLGGNSAGYVPTGEAMAGAPPASPAGGASPKPIAPLRPPLGEAARSGGDAMANLVQEVNFPAFVGGLIDGVFNSIVTSSIKQMEAYAELVKNVSKSVDQYMKDNVSEQNARDYLVDRYPEHLDMDFSAETPKLKPREGADDNNLPDFFSDLGIKMPGGSLDQDQLEQQLVPAARQRIAMDRQQLLATMVMMGVNRLVVTNGAIEASCLFKLDTRDTRIRDRVGNYNSNYTRNSHQDSGGKGDSSWDREYKENDWLKSGKRGGSSSWYNNSTRDENASFTVATVDTNKSEDEIKLHAELAGKVKLNFKSDYFPLEKMVDVLQINQIREKTAAPQQQSPAQAQPAPPPLPPMPAMPQIPGVTAPAAPAPAAPVPAPTR